MLIIHGPRFARQCRALTLLASVLNLPRRFSRILSCLDAYVNGPIPRGWRIHSIPTLQTICSARFQQTRHSHPSYMVRSRNQADFPNAWRCVTRVSYGQRGYERLKSYYINQTWAVCTRFTLVSSPEIIRVRQRVNLQLATVGLWVSESQREPGISSHDPWPAYGMCEDSDHSGRHVSWWNDIYTCSTLSNDFLFIFIFFKVITILRQLRLYILLTYLS